MNMNVKEDIVIRDSNQKSNLGFLRMLYGALIFSILCFFIYPFVFLNCGKYCVLFIPCGIFMSILFISLIIYRKKRIPDIYVVITLSNEGIQVVIQEFVYFNQRWSTMNTIEIIKIKIPLSYKINFVGPENASNTLRLSLIMLHAKVVAEIIDYLKKFASTHTIEVVEKSIKYDDYAQYDKEFKRYEDIARKKIINID